jgi:hypothetical protein
MSMRYFKAFPSKFDRDVFFLRRIHDSYGSFWAPLVSENITATDYQHAPAKMQRFIEELGIAMEGRNDLVACTNLALITSDPPTPMFTTPSCSAPRRNP